MPFYIPHESLSMHINLIMFNSMLLFSVVCEEENTCNPFSESSHSRVETRLLVRCKFLRHASLYVKFYVRTSRPWLDGSHEKMTGIDDDLKYPIAIIFSPLLNFYSHLASTSSIYWRRSIIKFYFFLQVRAKQVLGVKCRIVFGFLALQVIWFDN